MAALIGPAVNLKGLVTETNFDAPSIFSTELAAALTRLRPAIEAPNPRKPTGGEVDHDFVDEDEEDDDSDAALGLVPGQSAKGPRITTKFLRGLRASNIYNQSVPRVQRVLASRAAAAEAVKVRDALLDEGDRANAARFVDRWQKGASAWLHATRKDERQRLKNPYFRVAVGHLLGINCFPEVPPETECPLCHSQVGPDIAAHTLACKPCRTGDNNRRHQAVQQLLLTFYVLRAQRWSPRRESPLPQALKRRTQPTRGVCST